MTDTTRDLIQRLANALAEWQLGGAPPEGTSDVDLINEARALLSQSEPEGPPLEPRGCPTPGACSCPTSPTVPTELRGQEGSNG